MHTKDENASRLRKLFEEQEATRSLDRIEQADLVIVGSGVAGLTAAITAAENLGPGQRVALITKTTIGAGGSSPFAQGGIAAAVGGAEDEEEHAADTLRVGRSLCEPGIVERLTGLGEEAIERLVSLGVRFDRGADGEYLLGREGGHHRRRVLHADGDATGKEIMRALRQSFAELIAEHPQVVVEEHFFAEDLVTFETTDRETGITSLRVAGVVGTRSSVADQTSPSTTKSTSQRVAWIAPKVLLATGGMGQLFQHTTNPSEVTGDGIAMAARGGAVLADMEMVQFHPTTLAVDPPAKALDGEGVEGLKGAAPKALLLTEALRGEGALLVDEHGERFMLGIHELAELAPRDIVARTLWQRSTEGKASFLDLRPVHCALVDKGSRLAERFPTAYRQCKSVGLDPLTVPVPVAPAAHYTMGGVWTDENGRTTIQGLFACGEVASSGVHGANRLASNSLLEGVVFGHEFTLGLLRAGVDPVSDGAIASHWQLGEMSLSEVLSSPVATAPAPSLRAKIQRRMWQSAGLVRQGLALAELDRELSILQRFRPDPGPEERNLLLLGRLLCAAALRRKESRGGHYRSDYPETDPRQAHRSLVTMQDLLGGAGERSWPSTQRISTQRSSTPKSSTLGASSPPPSGDAPLGTSVARREAPVPRAAQ